MSKAFDIMKANVGNMVMDTSAAFSVLIGNWLNDRYLDIARRMPWSVLIDNSHTIAVTALAGAMYDLPADFEEEINCIDITNGVRLERFTEALWWRSRGESYLGGTLQTGQPTRYMILKEAGKISLDPAPSADFTLAFPYKKVITALTSDDTVVIKDIEYLMEFGAVAEALAYKKQYQKASYYMQRYESELARRLSQEKSPMNQMNQWIPEGHEISGPMRLTGENSYDDLI